MKEYIVMESFYKALEKDRIQPFYQPQFKSNGFDIVSAEALCRWVKSDGSLILPVDFLPLTEESGEICMLDWFIIDRVCSFLADMLFMNEKPVPVSVNLSRRHVEEMNAAEHLCTIVDAYRLNHDLIEVEITETCDADMNRLKQMIKNIRDSGFKVAVDDFGKGNSTFEFIYEMEFDIIKLDRSLLHGDCSDERSREILRSIVKLGKDLGATVVAEGVETVEQLSFLSLINCPVLQGNLLSEPLSKTDFIKLINEHRVYNAYPLVIN